MSAGKARRGARRGRGGSPNSTAGHTTTEAGVGPMNADPAEHILHCRVGIYWPDDDRYYRGVITTHTPEQGYIIEYDDGDNESLSLTTEQFKWYGPRGCTAPQPYRPAMRAAMARLGAMNVCDAEIAPEPCPPPEGGAPLGDNATGWRLGVFWGGTGSFVSGEVLSYDAKVKRHHVLYDDGEHEWLDLGRECVRWDGRVRGSPVAYGLEGVGQGDAPKGKAAIGWRIAVYWPKLLSFREGEITGFDSNTGKHTVVYDSSSEESISLTSRKLIWRIPPGLLGHAQLGPELPPSRVNSAAPTPSSELPALERAVATSSATSTGQKPESTLPALPARTQIITIPALDANGAAPAADRPPKSATPTVSKTSGPSALTSGPSPAVSGKPAASHDAADNAAAASKPPLPVRKGSRVRKAAGKGVRCSTSSAGNSSVGDDAMDLSCIEVDQQRSHGDAAPDAGAACAARAPRAAKSGHTKTASLKSFSTKAEPSSQTHLSTGSALTHTPAKTKSLRAIVSPEVQDESHGAFSSRVLGKRKSVTGDGGALCNSAPERGSSAGASAVKTPCLSPRGDGPVTRRSSAPHADHARPAWDISDSDDDDDLLSVAGFDDAEYDLERAAYSCASEMYEGATFKYADQLCRDEHTFGGDPALLKKATRSRLQHIGWCLMALASCDARGSSGGAAGAVATTSAAEPPRGPAISTDAKMDCSPSLSCRTAAAAPPGPAQAEPATGPSAMSPPPPRKPPIPPLPPPKASAAKTAPQPLSKGNTDIIKIAAAKVPSGEASKEAPKAAPAAAATTAQAVAAAPATAAAKAAPTPAPIAPAPDTRERSSAKNTLAANFPPPQTPSTAISDRTTDPAAAAGTPAAASATPAPPATPQETLATRVTATPVAATSTKTPAAAATATGAAATPTTRASAGPTRGIAPDPSSTSQSVDENEEVLAANDASTTLSSARGRDVLGQSAQPLVKSSSPLLAENKLPNGTNLPCPPTLPPAAAEPLKAAAPPKDAQLAEEPAVRTATAQVNAPRTVVGPPPLPNPAAAAVPVGPPKGGLSASDDLRAQQMQLLQQVLKDPVRRASLGALLTKQNSPIAAVFTQKFLGGGGAVPPLAAAAAALQQRGEAGNCSQAAGVANGQTVAAAGGERESSCKDAPNGSDARDGTEIVQGGLTIREEPAATSAKG